MSAESFIGRTITGLEVDDYNRRWLLRLDDGTAVEFAVEGYEGEGDVTHLTDEVIRQRALDAEAERLARGESVRLAKEQAILKRAHMAEMREQLNPEAFEKWRRETYPTLPETLKDVWASGPLLEQWNTGSPLASITRKDT